MRKLILTLTAIVFVPTALAALTVSGGLVGNTDALQTPQAHSGGVGGSGHGSFLRGHQMLAKGDMMGTGGGAGGMMGAMKGGMKGGMSH